MNQSQSTEPAENIIFYYRNSCPYCLKFNSLLQRHPRIDKLIQKVSVDQIIPRGIRMTPSLVVNSHLLEGSAAFEWLKDKKNKASFVELGTEKQGAAFSFLSNKEGRQNVNQHGLDSRSAVFENKEPNRMRHKTQ